LAGHASEVEAIRRPAVSPSMTSRRFPAPWRAEPIPGGYVVRDANGQALALQAKMPTKEEARRIAINIARQPALLGNAGREEKR
jgi:hypothetical protein